MDEDYLYVMGSIKYADSILKAIREGKMIVHSSTGKMEFRVSDQYEKSQCRAYIFNDTPGLGA